jgi:succinate-semialdehyde dehydrogenase/glutarate-semialdehyde dehydrogenase
VLEGAARLMLERREDLARIATLEQGKTLAEARIEVMMNVGLFRFYAGEVQRLYGRRWCARQASAPAWCTNPWGPWPPLRRGTFRWAIRGASWPRRSRRAAR